MQVGCPMDTRENSAERAKGWSTCQNKHSCRLLQEHWCITSCKKKKWVAHKAAATQTTSTKLQVSETASDSTSSLCPDFLTGRKPSSEEISLWKESLALDTNLTTRAASSLLFRTSEWSGQLFLSPFLSYLYSSRAQEKSIYNRGLPTCASSLCFLLLPHTERQWTAVLITLSLRQINDHRSVSNWETEGNDCQHLVQQLKIHWAHAKSLWLWVSHLTPQVVSS